MFNVLYALHVLHVQDAAGNKSLPAAAEIYYYHLNIYYSFPAEPTIDHLLPLCIYLNEPCRPTPSVLQTMGSGRLSTTTSLRSSPVSSRSRGRRIPRNDPGGTQLDDSRVQR